MKPIHNLLRHRLHGTRKPIIGHPPIDLLSAFSEKALSGFERDSVITHLAQCEDCRDLAFLAAPEVTAPVSIRPPASRASAWTSSPAFRWVSVAACAMVVFAALRLRPEHPSTSTFAPVHNVTQAPNPAADGKGLSSVPPTASPSSPHDQLEAVPGKAKEPESSTLQQQRFEGQGVVQETSFGGFQVPRWTLTTEGKLERSLDNGVSWRRVPVPETRKIHVLAADGLNIWVGGEHGTLLHSPDAGQHWRELKPVVGDDDLIADIIAIQFDDTQHGMLTTFGDGTWMTSNGGRSWEKQ